MSHSLKKKLLLEYKCSTMLCWFLLYSKVNHLYPLSSEFHSHVGHCRALSSLTQGSNSCLLHCRQILYCLSHQGNPRFSLLTYFIHRVIVHICQVQSPSSSHPRFLSLVSMFVLYLCLYFYFANKIICIIFLDSTLCVNMIFIFLFLTYFILCNSL